MGDPRPCMNTEKNDMPEIFELQFMQRALAAGVLTGFTLSLLGVFVVLRRSAFFGDAIAHFAFTGIALGFLFAVDPIMAAVLVSVTLALGMGYLHARTPSQSLDTVIGIFFSGAAALGIFIIGLLEGYRVDLFQFLFGDIIAVSFRDVLISLVSGIGVGIAFLYIWKPLFKITFHREIARVSGVSVAFYDYCFLGLLALVTAVSIKIVGIILVPALLVIPAASAKNISRSFRGMIIWAVILGVGSVVLGLVGSFYLDTASGATVVLASIIGFALTLFFRGRR